MFEAVAEVIGENAAAKLKRAFGGISLYIPVADDRDIERRNAMIRAAAALAKKKGEPLPIAMLMSKHELSRRQIFNILGEA